MTTVFRFGFDQVVTVVRSGESGAVIGVADYKRNSFPLYLIEYKSADGRATERWFHEDELTESATA